MEQWWTRSVKHLQEELKFLGVSMSYDDVHEIQFLAERKYNRYDQYLPGETFQYRLIKWLNNFEEEDRSTAMEIVKNLVYFNRHELRALSVTTFWNCIKIIQNVLSDQSKIKKIYKFILRK